MSSLAPAPAARCPLCNGPNQCAVVICGSTDTPCWCRSQSFPAELLARVPDSLKGKACICSACALQHPTRNKDA